MAPAAYALARIEGTRVNLSSEVEAVRRIVTDAVAGRGGTALMLGLGGLADLRADKALRAAYQRATYVMAEGTPVASIARRAGAAIAPVRGDTLALALCRAAALTRMPVFLVGEGEVRLRRAASRLRVAAPGLAIAGLAAADGDLDPFGADARQLAAEIDASGAGVCLLALRSPVRELFANVAVCRTRGVVHVGVGPVLDHVAADAGRVARPSPSAGDTPLRFGRAMRSAVAFVRHMTAAHAPGDAAAEPRGARD